MAVRPCTSTPGHGRAPSQGVVLAAALMPAEHRVVHKVLHAGALLEDERIAVTGKMVRVFVAHRGAQRDDLLVPNGLPRHPGQALALVLAPQADVQTVVHLGCAEDAVRVPLQADPAGDRAGRMDDHGELVAARLRAYHQRIAPLLAHHRATGAEILQVDVAAHTRPDQVWRRCHPPRGARDRR